MLTIKGGFETLFPRVCHKWRPINQLIRLLTQRNVTSVDATKATQTRWASADVRTCQ